MPEPPTPEALAQARYIVHLCRHAHLINVLDAACSYCIACALDAWAARPIEPPDCPVPESRMGHVGRGAG